jgi:hypothetical protein
MGEAALDRGQLVVFAELVATHLKFPFPAIVREDLFWVGPCYRDREQLKLKFASI